MDQALTDETAGMLGTVARLVDQSFFQLALELWHAAVDRPPKAFAIAWTAMSFHVSPPALASTLRYPSEPAFLEESVLSVSLHDGWGVVALICLQSTEVGLEQTRCSWKKLGARGISRI